MGLWAPTSTGFRTFRPVVSLRSTIFDRVVFDVIQELVLGRVFELKMYHIRAHMCHRVRLGWSGTCGLGQNRGRSTH